MDIPAEVWIAAFYGGIISLAAVGRYLARPKETRQNSVIGGIALGFGDERALELMERMAKALEVLADRRTEEIEDIHKALLVRLDAQERRKEQEEQRPRRQPARRPR